MFPMVIYIANIFLVMAANFLLAHYIFRKKPQLSIPGHEVEKNYIYMQSKMAATLLLFVFIILSATAILSRYNNDYMVYSLYSLFLGAIVMRRRLKKYRPKKTFSSAD